MKKVPFVILLSLFSALVSCGNNSPKPEENKEQNATTTPAEMKEATTLDSLSTELDKTKSDIDESIKNLENNLKKLEN